MAKTIDILEIERARAANGDYATIHLFVEGTFYRAYEWSAWLCCRYINEFKPTKRELKSEAGETIVYIGFPTSSLSRYIPENAGSKVNDDNSVDIILALDVFRGQEWEQLQSDFTNWKNSVPMALSKKSSVRDSLNTVDGEQPHRMSDILMKVLAFPVEQKTPMDCMYFITEIKQDITKLL